MKKRVLSIAILALFLCPGLKLFAPALDDGNKSGLINRELLSNVEDVMVFLKCQSTRNFRSDGVGRGGKKEVYNSPEIVSLASFIMRAKPTLVGNEFVGTFVTTRDSEFGIPYDTFADGPVNMIEGDFKFSIDLTSETIKEFKINWKCIGFPSQGEVTAAVYDHKESELIQVVSYWSASGRGVPFDKQWYKQKGKIRFSLKYLDAQLAFIEFQGNKTTYTEARKEGDIVLQSKLKHKSRKGPDSDKGRWNDLDHPLIIFELNVNMPPPIRLIDEQVKVYELENKSVDKFSRAPKVKCEISETDWSKLLINPGGFTPPGSLFLKYDIKISAKSTNPLDKWTWEKSLPDAGFRLSDYPSRYKFDGLKLTYWEPLYEFLQRLNKDPYQVLHDIYYSRKGTMPLLEPIILTVAIKPTDVFSMFGTPPQKRNIEIEKPEWTEATYILGAEFDLEKETILKIGKSDHANWEDYTEIAITILKVGAWAVGAELTIDLIDIMLESVAIAGCALDGNWTGISEGLLDIASTALPAPWEFIFAAPEGYALGKHYSTKPSLLRKVRERLGRGGFFPLKCLRASKDYPLLVNLEKEKLAFVDPAGIVHSVKTPSGMRIAYPYFSLVEGEGWGRVFIQSVMDRTGKFKEWGTGAIRAPNIFGPYAVIPPPFPFRPIRFMLRGAPLGKREPSYEYGGFQLTFGTHDIQTGKKGQIILSDYGDKVGILDLGWEDNPPGLVFKKPYACLVSGKLHVKGVPLKMGVGFYKSEPIKHAEGLEYPSDVTSPPRADRKVGRKFVPEVWIEPKGTEYTIEVDPDTRQFTVSVIEGYVELSDVNGIFIDSVDPGQRQILSMDKIRKTLEPILAERKRSDETKEIQTLPAVGGIIFLDDFNSENSGNGALNYRGFRNWEVSDGEVDLIGNGFWDSHPDHGLHLDLDGSVNKAGTLQTRRQFHLPPGVYSLEFDLAGSFQRTTNTVSVSLGNVYREEFTLEATEPFRKIRREIIVSSVMEARLVFEHEGGDNLGLLLDNVQLSRAVSGDDSVTSSSKQTIIPAEGLHTYFGIAFDRHKGEGIKVLGVVEDTPAQNTGLQKGDIIHSVENVSLRDQGPHPEQFAGMIRELSVDKPLRFHIERNGKKFDVWIKPLRIDKNQLAVFQARVQDQFSSDYSKGVQLLAKDEYEDAIGYFMKSLESRPMESYRGLGICYYHLRNHKEARKCLEKAIKLDKNQPLSWFYGAANMDALNKRNGAIDGYKKYLKFNHDNEKMNAFARERLDALQKNKKSDLNKKLLKAIDVILKEIEK